MGREPQVIKGIDTILGLVGNPPKVISIPKKLIVEGTSLLREWNSYYLAFIPYCYTCKEPLDWVQGHDQVVFACPKCGRKWMLEGEENK